MSHSDIIVHYLHCGTDAFKAYGLYCEECRQMKIKAYSMLKYFEIIGV